MIFPDAPRLCCSSLERIYVYKLTFFQLLNTILIPLIVSRKNTWYVRGGLVEQAFYIQIFNAALSDVTKLLDPVYFLRAFREPAEQSPRPAPAGSLAICSCWIRVPSL